MNKQKIIKNYIEKHKDEFFDNNDKTFVNAIALFKAEKETGIDSIDFMSYLRYGKVF